MIHLTSRTNSAILDYACKIIAASFPRIDDIKDVAPFFTKGGVVSLIRVGLQDSTANSSAAFALFKCLERHPVVGLQLKSFIANPDLLTTLVKSMAAPDTSNSVRILLVEVLGLLLGSTKSTALVTGLVTSVATGSLRLDLRGSTPAQPCQREPVVRLPCPSRHW